MTIRTRLTLWYAVIFSVSLLVIGVSTYSELVVETARQNRAPPRSDD